MTIRDKILLKDLVTLKELASVLGYGNIIISLGVCKTGESGSIRFCTTKFISKFNKEFIQNDLSIQIENKDMVTKQIDEAIKNYGKIFKN